MCIAAVVIFAETVVLIGVSLLLVFFAAMADPVDVGVVVTSIKVSSVDINTNVVNFFSITSI